MACNILRYRASQLLSNAPWGSSPWLAASAGFPCPNITSPSTNTFSATPCPNFTLCTTLDFTTRRGMSTGAPGIRKEVTEQLSTINGGHVARMIKYSDSIHILDDVLWKHRRALQPCHMAVAALALGELYPREKGTPKFFKIHQVGLDLERHAFAKALKFTSWNVASYVYGMSCAKYRLRPELLTRFAAVLLGNDCHRLRFMTAKDMSQLMWAYQQQGYTVKEFWQKAGEISIPQIPEWPGHYVTSMLLSAAQTGLCSDEFLQAAAQRLEERAHKLTTSDLRMVVQALGMLPGDFSNLHTKLLTQLLTSLNEFTPDDFTDLLTCLHDANKFTPKLRSAAEAYIDKFLADFTLHNLSAVVRVIAAAGCSDIRLLDATAHKALSCLEREEPIMKDVAFAALCFGGLPAEVGGRVLTRITDAVVHQFRWLPAGDQMDLLQAYRMCGHPDLEKLLGELRALHGDASGGVAVAAV